MRTLSRSIDGTFTITDLPEGLHLLNVDAFDHLRRNLNVTIGGDTNIGDIALIRRPFRARLTVGEIPPSGGSIAV